MPVRKPSKEWWIRTHPEPEYRLQTAVIELKEEREIYLVDPNLYSELATESTVVPKMLFTAISRQGVVFLWQVRLPGPDGRIDNWSQSALAAAEMATTQWVCVQPKSGFYEVSTSTAPIPDPDWPEKSFQELLTIAFKGQYIDSLDHPVIQQLRGEA